MPKLLQTRFIISGLFQYPLPKRSLMKRFAFLALSLATALPAAAFAQATGDSSTQMISPGDMGKSMLNSARQSGQNAINTDRQAVTSGVNTRVNKATSGVTSRTNAMSSAYKTKKKQARQERDNARNLLTMPKTPNL